MHAVRSAARPKLSLAVPSATKPSVPQLVIPGAVSSRPICSVAGPATLPSPSSTMTPTARNTLLNQRGVSTLQVPSFERGTPAKKNSKKVSFSEAARVELISPCPSDYYGEYVKMSREERRWGRPS